MLGQGDIAELQGEAEAIYRAAGFEPDEQVPIGLLCRQLLGVSPIHAPLRGVESEIKGEQIIVRGSTPAPRARWLAAHELAEHWLQLQGMTTRAEWRADALGAALIVPPRVIDAAVRAHGTDVGLLADILGTTQSLVLLRIGEHYGDPTALIRDRRRPIVRGAHFGWPLGLSLKKAAKLNVPGLRKVLIQDEPRRLGLVADGAWA